MRSQVLRKQPNVLDKKGSEDDPLNLHCTMFQLWKELTFTKQTTPGKDMVCYKMLANMTVGNLEIIQKKLNKIWEFGQPLTALRHAIIVPVLKPGKSPPQPW